MRGEDGLELCQLSVELGSPPHARGRHAGLGRSNVGYGITPACAGKTKPRWLREVRRGDHPRMRGEDS